MNSFLWTVTIINAVGGLCGIWADESSAQRVGTVVALGIAFWGGYLLLINP